MILVSVLIFFGLIVIFSSMAMAYWLASLGCTMAVAECTQSGGELYIGFMFSLVGVVFWATLAFGIFMLWWGFRVKTHHLQSSKRSFNR